MRPSHRASPRSIDGSFIILILLLAALNFQVRDASGEIINITGSSAASIIQFEGPIPVQTDFSQAIVPLTVAEPPAVSRARIDHLKSEDEQSAGAQALAVFDRPNLSGIGNPNDVGLDLGALSDDPFISWFVEGNATETRTIVLNPAEVGADLLVGTAHRARSRVILSGVLIITSTQSTRNLSGVEATIQLRVTRRRLGLLPDTLLEGEVILAGGPGGSVSITRADGAFTGLNLSVVDFSGVIPGIPLVQALPFTGLGLPYDYDFAVGVPFDLELSVSSRMRTIPDGVAAASVFGVPQEGLAAIFESVEGDDRGRRLSDTIAQHVDTTGAAYVEGDSAPPGPLLLPFCGLMGIETMGLMLIGAGWMAGRSMRRFGQARRERAPIRSHMLVEGRRERPRTPLNRCG